MHKRYHGIGKRFAVLRGERSYRQFERNSGISQALLQRYETNGGLPSVENLIQLVKKEKIHLDWLLLGKGPMSK